MLLKPHVAAMAPVAAGVPARGAGWVCDLMGTLQQQTQRKPAMLILTTRVRVTMPAARPAKSRSHYANGAYMTQNTGVFSTGLGRRRRPCGQLNDSVCCFNAVIHGYPDYRVAFLNHHSSLFGSFSGRV
jgi:hypothetical protein